MSEVPSITEVTDPSVSLTDILEGEGSEWIRIHRHALGQLFSQWMSEAESSAREVANRIQDERQAIEDSRANHRNLNRMLTLFGALLIGIVDTYLLTHPVLLVHTFGLSPKLVKFLAPYTFVITIAMDSTLAVYSFIRHY